MRARSSPSADGIEPACEEKHEGGRQRSMVNIYITVQLISTHVALLQIRVLKSIKELRPDVPKNVLDKVLLLIASFLQYQPPRHV